jgi:hypothetical protein
MTKGAGREQRTQPVPDEATKAARQTKAPSTYKNQPDTEARRPREATGQKAEREGREETPWTGNTRVDRARLKGWQEATKKKIHRKPNRGRSADEITGKHAHVRNISQSKLNSSRY